MAQDFEVSPCFSFSLKEIIRDIHSGHFNPSLIKIEFKKVLKSENLYKMAIANNQSFLRFRKSAEVKFKL
jgi:hypothetical protein